MRVASFAAFGDPSVLRVERRADPRAPRGSELLVEVAACSVNGTDLGVRRGDIPPATWGRMPFVPGFDIAGRVLAVGPAVTTAAPGDRVAALLPLSGGGLAERVLVDQDRSAPIPDTVATTQAAAVTLAGLTALQGLDRHGRLRARPGPDGGPPRSSTWCPFTTWLSPTSSPRPKGAARSSSTSPPDSATGQAEDVTVERWLAVERPPGALRRFIHQRSSASASSVAAACPAPP